MRQCAQHRDTSASAPRQPASCTRAEGIRDCGPVILATKRGSGGRPHRGTTLQAQWGNAREPAGGGKASCQRGPKLGRLRSTGLSAMTLWVHRTHTHYHYHTLSRTHHHTHTHTHTHYHTITLSHYHTLSHTVTHTPSHTMTLTHTYYHTIAHYHFIA